MTGSRYVYAYGSALATLAYGAGPTTGYATDASYVLATYAPSGVDTRYGLFEFRSRYKRISLHAGRGLVGLQKNIN